MAGGRQSPAGFQLGAFIIGEVEQRHGSSMRRNRSGGESGPLTLGQAHAAKVQLIVWCKACRREVVPDIAALIAQHGADTTVIDWARRLRCSACGERSADFVVSGVAR